MLKLKLLILITHLICLISGEEPDLIISEEKNVKVFGSNMPGVYLFRKADSHQELDEIFLKVYETITQTDDRVVFIISDLKSELELRTASTLRVKPHELPLIKVYDTSSDEIKEHTMKEGFTVRVIVEFIKKALNLRDNNEL